MSPRRGELTHGMCAVERVPFLPGLRVAADPATPPRILRVCPELPAPTRAPDSLARVSVQRPPGSRLVWGPQVDLVRDG